MVGGCVRSNSLDAQHRTDWETGKTNNMNSIHRQDRTGQISPMPKLSFFRQELIRKCGKQTADDLSTRFQARYNALYAQRPVFAQKALRDHVEGNILSGLAVYQIFLAEGMNQEAALNATQDLLTALVNQGMTRQAKLLSRLPGTYHFLRWLTPWMMNTQFCAPGFDFQWVENSRRQSAFTMTRCLYHNTLTAYGAPELTSVFCHLDDVWGAALIPKVLFVRPNTIGRGGNQCDFCYKRGSVG